MHTALNNPSFSPNQRLPMTRSYLVQKLCYLAGNQPPLDVEALLRQQGKLSPTGSVASIASQHLGPVRYKAQSHWQRGQHCFPAPGTCQV
jgi:hypothetical protein